MFEVLAYFFLDKNISKGKEIERWLQDVFICETYQDIRLM